MYKCNQCGKEFERVGPKNLHEYHCTLRAGFTGAKVEKAKPTAPVNNECNHDWRLLGNSQAEQLAKSQGFTKYCSECEDLG